jgi:hypothetical protein
VGSAALRLRRPAGARRAVVLALVAALTDGLDYDSQR